MPWVRELWTIYQKLSSYEHIRKRLMQAQLNGCSRGGVYYLVLQQLVTIRKENAQIYELIRKEADNIIHHPTRNT